MFEKKFSLTMELKDMAVGKEQRGTVETHFEVPWCLSLERRTENLAVFLRCEKPMEAKKPWTIDVTCKARLVSVMRKVKKSETFSYAYRKSIGYGWTDFMNWKDAIEENTDDDTAVIQLDVTIDKMTGFGTKRQRSFEEPDEHLTDMVLTVGEQKFHVAKMTLAAQSSYFKSLFFGKVDEVKKREIEMKDVDANVFQSFLEVIYGQFEITSENVAGLLQLGDKFDVPLVRSRCEEFLRKSDEMSKKKKLRLADTFQLKNLMNDCIEAMKTSEDIKTYVPIKLTDLSHSTLAAILEKTLSFD